MNIAFRPMLASDVVLLELQPSQHYELGIEECEMTIERGRDLAENGIAWTGHVGSRILFCGGFRQIYEGQAVCWAALTADVGTIAGGKITAFVRDWVARSPYRRLEAIVEADNTRAVEWATRVGLVPAHVLRRYGANDETHILFERVQ